MKTKEILAYISSKKFINILNLSLFASLPMLSASILHAIFDQDLRLFSWEFFNIIIWLWYLNWKIEYLQKPKDDIREIKLIISGKIKAYDTLTDCMFIVLASAGNFFGSALISGMLFKHFSIDIKKCLIIIFIISCFICYYLVYIKKYSKFVNIRN